MQSLRLVLALLSLTVLACIPPALNFDPADDQMHFAIVEFHKRYNGQDAKSAYNLLHPVLRKQVDLGQFEGILKTRMTKLGKALEFRRTARRETTYEGQKGSLYEVETRFEQGTGTETFTFLNDAGRDAIAAYHLTAPGIDE